MAAFIQAPKVIYIQVEANALQTRPSFFLNHVTLFTRFHLKVHTDHIFECADTKSHFDLIFMYVDYLAWLYRHTMQKS